MIPSSFGADAPRGGSLMHVRLGCRTVVASCLAALVLPCSDPLLAEEPPAETLTHFASYPSAVPAAGIGSFADFPVSRTFDRRIASLRLFIVAGRADDIGFVGSRAVTSPPQQIRDG